MTGPEDDQFPDLMDFDGVARSAADFWTTPHTASADHPNCHYHYEFDADNSHGVKYDPHTGEVLFFDITNNAIVGYFLDEGFNRSRGGVTRHYSSEDHHSVTDMSGLLSSLKQLHGLSGNPSNLQVGNQSISLPAGKTTVFMGSFSRTARPLSTTQAVGGSKYLTNTDFDVRLGGYQILNVPDSMYRLSVRQAAGFWGTYNGPWIDRLARDVNTEFVVLTNPMDVALLFRNGNLSGFGHELSTLLNGPYNLDLQLYGDDGLYKWVNYSDGQSPDQTEEDELRALLEQ
jgi:hypothetical protein